MNATINDTVMQIDITIICMVCLCVPNMNILLSLKALITTTADDTLKYCFSEKIKFDISCESSAADDSYELSGLIFNNNKNSDSNSKLIK